MAITSRPATREYLEGFERTFGKRQAETQEAPATKPDGGEPTEDEIARARAAIARAATAPSRPDDDPDYREVCRVHGRERAEFVYAVQRYESREVAIAAIKALRGQS